MHFNFFLNGAVEQQILYLCIFVFLYFCIFVFLYFCIHFLEELSRRNVPLSMEQPRKPNFLVLLMWSHLSCQHYSNFSAENKLATQRKEFCWTRGFGRHESLEVIHKQAHNALQWSIYRIGSSPLYQMKKQISPCTLDWWWFLAIFLCCFVLQRSGADEDQTFWSLLLVGIGQLGVGRRERLISISITVAIIIIMIINVIIITIVTTIITIIGVGELGERERVYLGKQKLFQLIYQII